MERGPTRRTPDETTGLGGFPTAPGGIIYVGFTYALADTPAFSGGFSAADLFPLTLREIVIHGALVPAGAGTGTGGEIDGTSGYKLTLPVLAGEIERVAPAPLPAAALMLRAALSGLGALRGVRGRA